MTSAHQEVERWSPFRVWLYGLHNRNPKSNLAAVDWLALKPGDHFLDLGCGLGAAVEHAAKKGVEVAGVDPSPSMVERASRRVPQAKVKVGSAEAIPFPDDSFTAVMAVSTYHHWADPAAGLGEVRRVLAPGGRLLLLERKVKRGEGHGLDDAGSEAVSAKLTEIGFVKTDVQERRVARADYLALFAALEE